VLRSVLGLVLVVGALFVGAIGALWTSMKASGAEVEYCPGATCTSGWYLATALLVGAVALGAIGAAILRRSGKP
jgi:hypothetical protein